MKKFLLFLVIVICPFSLYGFDFNTAASLNGIIENTARFSTGGKIFAPYYSDVTKQLIVFSEDSRIYIFKNSSLIKKIKLTSSPLFKLSSGRDTALYGCFKDRTLRAYNRSGNLLWLKKLPSEPVFPPVINSSGNILVFLSDNTVLSYALNGRLRWKRETEIKAEVFPVSYKNGVIFHNNNDFTVLNDSGITIPVPDSGRGISYFTASGKLFSVKDKISKTDCFPDSYEGGINGDSDSILKNNSSECYKFCMLDSKMNTVWATLIKGKPSDIKIYKKNIYILTDKSIFYKFNFNGGITAEKRIDSRGEGRILVLDNFIYLLNKEASIKLYSRDFDFTDRISISPAAVKGLPGSTGELIPQPCFSGGDSMAVGGLDWILYFFRISDNDSFKEDLPSPPDDRGIYSFTDRLRYINELSKSGRYENRMKSISLIEELIDEGGLSRYEYEILDILFRLGTEGTVTLYRNNPDEKGDAVIRSRAGELIYSAGTEKSYSMIRKMINAENDEYVIIKDIEFLGKGGSDPDLKTLAVFREVLEKSKYNIRICYAVVSASEGIADYQGYLHDEYSRMLLDMMNMHSDKKLKDKVIRLLVKKRY